MWILRFPVNSLSQLDSSVCCFSGRAVEEQQSLMELGVRPHGSTRMEMSSTDPNAHPLRPLRPPEHDNMPDVITVRVQAGVIHRDLLMFVSLKLSLPCGGEESVNAALHELLFAGLLKENILFQNIAQVGMDYYYRIRVLDQKILDVSCLTLLFQMRACSRRWWWRSSVPASRRLSWVATGTG